jgi:hypothetical protein
VVSTRIPVLTAPIISPKRVCLLWSEGEETYQGPEGHGDGDQPVVGCCVFAHAAGQKRLGVDDGNLDSGVSCPKVTWLQVS